MKFTLALIITSAAFAGCANTSGNTNTTCQPVAAGSSVQRPTAWKGTVFTVVMENKSYGDIIGNSGAPFINQLAKQNAIAAGYHDPDVHPSEPNYLWMVSGENFGVLDDSDPSAHPIKSTSHIADQIEMAGLTWKSYQESMGAPCGVKSAGRYAAKHDPFVFFTDINGWDGSQFQPSQRCNDHVVDYSQFDVDLAAGKLPDYVFITPNLDHDMHDGTVAQGDQWLKNEIPKILGSDAFNNGGVLFLLWDEGSGTFGPSDDPPFIAISPNAKPGFLSTTDYDTSSYLLTVQKILGVAPLPCASATDRGGVQSMDDLFSVAMPSSAP
jgi:phospholipase C